MIAAAAVQPASSGLPFNWFDVALVVVLGFGLYRGRRNGMSKELLPLLQWLAVVLVCGLVHPRLGDLIMGYSGMTKMWSYIAAYVTLMLALLIPFAMIRHHLTEPLTKSDYFKGAEYYLGMISGVIRVACILMVALALLNAPIYTQAEIMAHQAYAQKTYGGGLYEGNYFPTLQNIQESVFKQSASGAFIANSRLAVLLIQSAAPQPPKPQPKITIGN